MAEDIGAVTGWTGVNGVAQVTDEATVGERGTPVRRPEWVAHVLDDSAEPPRAVLLHLPSGRRTALSDTGTRIWREIVASGAVGIDLDTIAEQIAPEYAVDPTIVLRDADQLLREMVAGGWLEQVGQVGHLEYDETQGDDER
jgi:hypothetical protein